MNRYSFEDFCEIVAALRGENGCPWDIAQTLESLKPCLLDETAEAVAGADIYRATGDGRNLCEELGDLLLQIVLQSRIAEEEGAFTMADVIDGISQKMIHRHPHVFAGEDMGPGDWDRLKAEEKKRFTDAELQEQKCAVLRAEAEIVEHFKKSLDKSV